MGGHLCGIETHTYTHTHTQTRNLKASLEATGDWGYIYGAISANDWSGAKKQWRQNGLASTPFPPPPYAFLTCHFTWNARCFVRWASQVFFASWPGFIGTHCLPTLVNLSSPPGPHTTNSCGRIWAAPPPPKKADPIPVVVP